MLNRFWPHIRGLGQIPQSLRYYIDWEALARDMALNGEIMVFKTGFDEVHVFWSR